jgi:hypothetical protein
MLRSMSGERREAFLTTLYAVLIMAVVAGVVGAFFDAVRPAALITIGAAVTVLLTVGGIDAWATGSRGWNNLVVTAGTMLFVEVVVVTVLSLLHAPWRATGLWFPATCAAVVLFVVITTVYTFRPSSAADGSSKTERTEEKSGLVVLVLGLALVAAVCVPSWRTGAIIVLVSGLTLLWWAACAWLVFAENEHLDSRRRAVRMVILGAASVAGLAATLIPVAVAGLFELAPVRYLGAPPGGWWAGLATGVGGLVALLTVNAVTAPRVPAPPPVPAPAPAPAAPVAAPELSLSPVAERALRVALADLPRGLQLTTGRLLAALVRTDVLVGWERIWLHTGGVDLDRLPTTLDAPAPVQTWRGIEVSGRLADAVWLAQRLGYRYDLLNGSTGVLTLALLARRGNGATEVLLAGGGLTHRDLLRRVQQDVLGTTLQHLHTIIPTE